MLLLILIPAIALPEAAALLLYKYTGDPTFRPFGISKNSLDQSDGQQAMNEVLVHIDWGAKVNSAISRQDVQHQIRKALDIYNIDFRLKFNNVTGQEINVTYIVEHNKFGPYLFQNASRGISAAVTAYRSMAKYYKPG